MNKLVYVNSLVHATHLHNKVTGEIIPMPPSSALQIVVDHGQKELLETVSYQGILYHLCIFTPKFANLGSYAPKLLGKPKYEELGVEKEELSSKEAKQFRRTKLHKATHFLYEGKITNNFVLCKSTIYFFGEETSRVLFTEYKSMGIIPLIRPVEDFKHRVFAIKTEIKIVELVLYLRKNLLSDQTTYIKMITPVTEKGNNELKRGFRHESQ